ncbi:hypothetical protein CPC08DRAFT_648401 [Agrocybe pediades]|nr:hypothetical protein CPC08DRAFT_648401 [Agrocybe pediades]
MPSNLRHNWQTREALDELNNVEAFRRLAGFGSNVMATWAPGVYNYYAEYLGNLYRRYPHLQKNFDNSIFPAATYNMGPQTACYRHTDYANLPFGMCAITALGAYDPAKGGHLVLWDSRLVIEFPPGSTILIPSSVMSHSNTAISRDETRYSFTQYAAGALFRWVDNNFMKATDYWESLTEEQRTMTNEKDSQRWIFGLSLLPDFEATCRGIVA